MTFPNIKSPVSHNEKLIRSNLNYYLINVFLINTINVFRGQKNCFLVLHLQGGFNNSSGLRNICLFDIVLSHLSSIEDIFGVKR